MINQQRIENNLLPEIPPLKRVFAFKDLPKNIRKNLLRMQNSDGDFLKLSSGETARLVIFMILWILFFIGLAAIIADDVNEEIMDAKRIIVFSIDVVLLFLWFVYFAAKLLEAFGARLKNRMYITPTEVIETFDEKIRFRELKDASEISVNKFSSDVGRRSKLEIKFDDGDAYSFYIGETSKSKQLSKMQNWQEKASNWKNEAVSAFQRGDTDYFKSHDIFTNLFESNVPILLRQSRTRRENLLLFATIILFTLTGAFIFFAAK